MNRLAIEIHWKLLTQNTYARAARVHNNNKLRMYWILCRVIIPSDIFFVFFVAFLGAVRSISLFGRFRSRIKFQINKSISKHQLRLATANFHFTIATTILCGLLEFIYIGPHIVYGLFPCRAQTCFVHFILRHTAPFIICYEMKKRENGREGEEKQKILLNHNLMEKIEKCFSEIEIMFYSIHSSMKKHCRAAR